MLPKKGNNWWLYKRTFDKVEKNNVTEQIFFKLFSKNEAKTGFFGGGAIRHFFKIIRKSMNITVKINGKSE